jgi:glutathione S-transferase
MILVGQYDSPYVRRVAISLRVLGTAYEHDTRSVFGDFEAMRRVNPLVRIPSLVLESGETLIDSAAILDWLDETVGPERALMPRSGAARRRALKLIALATGVVDKIGATVYERNIRPSPYRWPEWIERCRIQGTGALTALAAERWPESAPLDQVQITMACVVRWLQIADPEVLASGAYPALAALSDRLEQRPEFIATNPPNYSVPRND